MFYTSIPPEEIFFFSTHHKGRHIPHMKASSLTLWQMLSTACKTACSVGWMTSSDVPCSRPAALFRNICSFSSAARVSRWPDWNLLSSSSSCFSRKLDSRRAASVTLLLASRPSIRVFFSSSMLFLPTTRPSNCCVVKMKSHLRGCQRTFTMAVTGTS